MFTSSEKKGKKFRLFRKSLLFFIAFLFSILCAYLIAVSLYPKFPSKKHPVALYSNQLHQNLQFLLKKSLLSARSSIHLVTFGLNDPIILHTLQNTPSTIQTKVFFDKSASPHIYLSNGQAYSMLNKGLLHQKILVIDNELSFLGSANFTHTSLLMHNNLIIAIYNQDLAKFLSQNTPFYSGYKKIPLPNQSLSIYLLPDPDHQALNHLISLLRSAKKSITLCMFTLTHPDLVQQLINAKKQNLKLSIYIDAKSALGPSKKTLNLLQQHNIPIFTSKGSELFHHKFALIDHTTLVLGSTNWTKNAFSKNNDCFLILSPLLHDQKKFLKKLTRTIKNQSQKYLPAQETQKTKKIKTKKLKNSQNQTEKTKKHAPTK